MDCPRDATLRRRRCGGVVHTGRKYLLSELASAMKTNSLHSASLKRFKPPLDLLKRFQNLSQHLCERWVVIRRFAKLADCRCDLVDKRHESLLRMALRNVV